MASTQLNKQLRLGMTLMAGGMGLMAGTPAAAQMGYSPPVYQEDPGTSLSRHLRTLAESPRNLSALTGAAKAALELGDAQAAATFYARAEEIAPRDGRIKAGLGSAFLAMEQPQAALKFFEDARAFGAPEAEFASDRGLAYDLLGNSAQAQRDYAIAMRSNDNDELRRRLALSKAISGDRAGALAAIDAQLRRQDRAAWRIRAFVLALTGDANGATEAVRAVMPAQASSMQPFLTRLPTLRPADRAMAVHFGHFPSDGSAIQMANVAPQPVRQQQYASVSPTVAQRVTTPASSAPSSSFAVPARRMPTAPASTSSARRQSSGQSGPSYGEERDLLRGGGTVRRRVSNRPVQADRPTALARTDARLPAQTQATSRPAGNSVTRPSVAQSNDPLARAALASRTTQPAFQAKPTQSTGSIQRPTVTSPPVTTQVTTAPVQKPVATAAPGGMQFAHASAAKPTYAPVQGPPAGSSPPMAVSPVTRQAAPTNLLPNIATAVSAQAAPSAVSTAANDPVVRSVGTTALLPSSAATSQPPASISVGPPATSISATAKGVSTPAAAAGLSSGLASIAATIRSLPSEEEAKPESKPVEKPAQTAAKAAVSEKKKEVAAEGAASRHWVQIASAPDKLVVSEYQRLKAKAPKLLADTAAWKASFRATNRVLVGPFEDQKDAQSLVNALAKANIDAVPWTSPEGQEIVKLSAK